MNQHKIRLRGPWQAKVLSRTFSCADSNESSSSGSSSSSSDTRDWVRQHLPATWEQWLGADFTGVVRYRRMFGCPTGLGAHDRVWLVIEAPPQQTSVVLNGKKLPSPTVEADYQRFQIMAQLQPRNELIIDLSHDESSSPGGLAGEVYLAIEARDHEARD